MEVIMIYDIAGPENEVNGNWADFLTALFGGYKVRGVQLGQRSLPSDLMT